MRVSSVQYLMFQYGILTVRRDINRSSRTSGSAVVYYNQTRTKCQGMLGCAYTKRKANAKATSLYDGFLVKSLFPLESGEYERENSAEFSLNGTNIKLIL